MADLNPPAWRGNAGSTFQHWMFSTPPLLDPLPPLPGGPPSTLPIAPEIPLNPFGIPWVHVEDVDPPTTEWRRFHAGMQGVWRLEPYTDGQFVFQSKIVGFIPNKPQEELQKLIRIQLTFERVTTDPDIFIGANGVAATLVASVEQGLQGNWVHVTYDYQMACDAKEEMLEIIPTDTVYIDQLVIDTICTCAVESEDKKPHHKKRRRAGQAA